MLETALSPGSVAAVPGFQDQYLRAYRFMLMARVLDERLAALYRAGKIFGGVFLGKGQEALSAAVGVHLRKGDVFAPLIRDAAGRLAFGESVFDAVRTYLGSPLGPMRSRDGNVHRGRPKEGLLPMISHLGAMISVVNGVLMARRMKGDTSAIGAACIGEGATSTGSCHEALNQAAVEKLPLILVVANNQYAYSTPTDRQFVCENLVDRAIGYGVQGHTVDGTDLGDCLETLGKAAANARAGKGPQLIVANLLRLCGHGEHDTAEYIDPKFKQSALGRDCLEVAEQRLGAEQWVDAAELERLRSAVVDEVEEVVATVQREQGPNPFTETWCALATRRLSDTTPAS
jgi:pyruvate dehydrogenase E1 component alpha subunit/2-oxoisovalerate dehydrogenase E1 component alpha subunit